MGKRGPKPGENPGQKRAPGAGRPKEPIDKQVFENMCKLQCTKQEMADFLDCSTSKIEKWCKSEYKDNFSNVYKRYTQGGKISLRRAMFRNAVEKDNATIQIWLSKQHLGMRDQHEVQVSVKPFVIEAPNGGEVMKLGVEQIQQIEGETIDVETIDASEKTYYDVEKLEDNIDELTENQSDID